MFRNLATRFRWVVERFSRLSLLSPLPYTSPHSQLSYQYKKTEISPPYLFLKHYSYKVTNEAERMKLKFKPKFLNIEYTVWVFYLESPKYLKKYPSYEKNIQNKNLILTGKSNCTKIYAIPWGGKGRNLKFKFLSWIERIISYKTYVFFNGKSESTIKK